MTTYRQEGLDTDKREALGFGPGAPGDFRNLGNGPSVQLAMCYAKGHANEAPEGELLSEFCIEPGCGSLLPSNPIDFYVIEIYYGHGGRGAYSESPSCETWTTAHGKDAAIEKARLASVTRPNDEFAVEGGKYEVGGWENPVFKGGQRLR
jgi:hypothetical protein